MTWKVHPSIHVMYDPAHFDRAVAHANTGNFVWMDAPVENLAAELREETSKALRARFGNTIRPGKKAFRIPKVANSRSDIDVAPTMLMHFITQTTRGRTILTGSAMDRVEGIALHDSDGKLTVNFPNQHHAAGKAKWRGTERHFKKVVRQLKMMRDHLVAEGTLEAGTIPSFLVENLVYNVENPFFFGHRRRLDRFNAILSRSYDQMSDPTWTATAMEISGWKRLFGTHASWSPDDCRRFLELAYAEVR